MAETPARRVPDQLLVEVGAVGGGVRLARPNATQAELDAAARAARLDEVIERLPNGWQTRVGEAGAQLSGGERQRVSIARAFLNRARVVLIDEAASALDPENEAAVEAADFVVALDGGRVAETGTPAALRNTGGITAPVLVQLEWWRQHLQRIPG